MAAFFEPDPGRRVITGFRVDPTRVEDEDDKRHVHTVLRVRLTAPPLSEVSTLADCDAATAGVGTTIDLTLSLAGALELAETLTSQARACDDDQGETDDRHEEPA